MYLAGRALKEVLLARFVFSSTFELRKEVSAVHSLNVYEKTVSLSFNIFQRLLLFMCSAVLSFHTLGLVIAVFFLFDDIFYDIDNTKDVI